MPLLISVRIEAYSFHCDSNAFELNSGINHGKITVSSTDMYIYILPLNLLFDSHCLRYKHQRPFKILKLYNVHTCRPSTALCSLSIMFSMMNDRSHFRPNCTAKCSAFLSSFGTKISHAFINMAHS